MATTQDKVKIVKTTNISNKDASIYGEDAVIFDISGGIYLGNNTKNGNKIAVSPNDLSTGLATKLNTSGGSISGALTLTGTTADKAAIDFSRVGYNYISIPEGDSRLAFSVGAHSIANTKMAILSSGRVGIGTTDPASALEVVGTVKATTFLGNLNGNANTATNAEQLNGMSIIHKWTGTNSGVPYVSANGAMEFGRIIDFHIASEPSGTDFATRLRCSDTVTGAEVYLPGTSGTLALTTSNVASATKLANTRKLWGQNFDGTGDVNGNLILYNADDLDNGNASSSKLVFGGSAAWRGPYIEGVAGGGWGMKNLVFYQYNTQEWPGDYSKHYAAMTLDVQGRLGIGTTTPTEMLHVNGNATIAGQLNVGNYIVSTRSGGDNSIQANNGVAIADMRVTSAGNVRLMRWKDSKGVVIIESDGTNTFLNTGKVAIGTSSPTEKLEVNGNVKATKFIGALQGNADSASMSYGLKTFLPANADANHNTFYIGGQYAVSTTEEEGKVFVGSSGNRKVISVPILDGSSTTANVMNLRMSFNANYWHDIATGPNRQDLCHRAVNNNTARDWSTILDSSNYTSYVVPKTGGTFTGQVKLQSAGGGQQLLINNTQNTETYFYLQAAGVNKAAFVTNNATYGTAIYDATSKRYLGIKSDGTPHYQGYELLSTYNYSTFTVPKAGGTFTGNVSAPDFITTSDARLKDFVDDIAIDFDALKSIPKKTYYWKDKDKYGDQLEIGTSAQELMKVYPECVSYDDESDKYSVNYQKLSIVALAAIDKLHDENAELKSRLDKIEKLLNI